MNRKNLVRGSNAFSGNLTKPDTQFRLNEMQRIIQKPPVKPIEPVKQKIEEDIITLQKGCSVLYKSDFDPSYIRSVQILKGNVVQEHYTVEFIDPYITKITALEDLIDCLVRIYFYEPVLVGVLEKIKESELVYDFNILEWDVNIDNNAWVNKITELNIGEPFIKGVYAKSPFSFNLKDKNGIEYTFQSPDIQTMTPQEPVPQEPVPQEPVPQEPVPQEPVPQEPVPQEPVPQEPVPQEPVPQEPVPQEPVPQEPVPQEPVPQEPVPQEPVPQEPVPQEPVPQEPVPQEPVPQEPVLPVAEPHSV
jgi:hypothetical protein